LLSSDLKKTLLNNYTSVRNISVWNTIIDRSVTYTIKAALNLSQEKDLCFSATNLFLQKIKETTGDSTSKNRIQIYFSLNDRIRINPLMGIKSRNGFNNSNAYSLESLSQMYKSIDSTKEAEKYIKMCKILSNNTKEEAKDETTNLHLLEFRIATPVPENCFKDMLSILENQNIRDIEIVLNDWKEIDIVLDIVKHNYMMKTLIITCDSLDKKSAYQKVKQISKGRVGFEVIFKRSHIEIATNKKGMFTIYYPC